MERLQNFIDGGWRASSANDALNVIDPASAKVLAEVPLSPATDVNAAVEVAERAFIEWRRTPVVDRIQPLFRLKTLLEQHREELALSITNECGKTLTESRAEILRAVENVETACAATRQTPAPPLPRPRSHPPPAKAEPPPAPWPTPD